MFFGQSRNGVANTKKGGANAQTNNGYKTKILGIAKAWPVANSPGSTIADNPYIQQALAIDPQVAINVGVQASGDLIKFHQAKEAGDTAGAERWGQAANERMEKAVQRGLPLPSVLTLVELFLIDRSARSGPAGIQRYESMKPNLMALVADFENKTVTDLVLLQETRAAEAAASATPPTPEEQLTGNNVPAHDTTAPADLPPTHSTMPGFQPPEEELDMTEVTFVASDESDEEKWLAKMWKSPWVKLGTAGTIIYLITQRR